MPVRVHLLENRPLVRRGLHALLSSHPDVALVGEAVEAGALGSALSASGAEVVLVSPDLLSPLPEALLHAGTPEKPWRVVVVGAGRSPAEVSLHLRQGIRWSIPLDADDARIIEAVLRFAALPGGRARASAASAPRVPTGSGPSQSGEHDAAYGLSARELEIVGLLVQGKTTSSIADELGLAGTTVSTFLRRIKDKLSVDTNHELVAFAAAAGLGLGGGRPEASATKRESR